jgi:delta 1-pyrroline-5-carboxylate dehydrogenase
MANPDPIANAIQLLNVLVVPTADGTGSPTTTPLYNTIKTFVGAIFGASTDMQTVSTDITKALNEAATVVGKIGTALQSAGSLSDVTNAMTALQNTLSTAQAMAPAGTAVVLNSASALFQQIQSQLMALASTPGATIGQAATELAQLSQLLTALAQLFP